jgi:N-acetylglucosamine-6-phosphate deacetylase
MTTPAGSILTPSGWVRGEVRIAGGRIVAVAGAALPEGAAPEPPYVLPGFIDLHCHGGGGTQCMEGEAALRAMLRFHAARGTVAMAPTTATAGANQIRAALADIKLVQSRPGPGEPVVLGAHLEGPFINPNKLGAQADVPLPGDPVLAGDWAAQFPIVVATVAPEIPGGLEVVRALAAHGCRVQVAHSLAPEDVLETAFACGCCGFTHLFNAMSGVHHREPGVAAWALAHAEHAEIICDLIHVRPTTLLAARRAIPRLYAITDASTAAGLPDGEYTLAGRKIVKRGLRVTLEDGATLAGSAITMADALRNLVRIGIPLAEASAMTSTRQADYLGRADLGRIAPGARACLVQLDGELAVRGVWIGGVAVAPAEDG